MSTTDDELPPPGFFHAFKPAEMIPEDGYGRFHAYLPPRDQEAEHDYARRLDKAGLAVAVTVDDARDPVKYRGLLAQADDRELPIVMLTGQLPDHYQDAQEASPLADPEARARYIAEARKTAAPFHR